MCSFLATTLDMGDFGTANELQQLRGPDVTTFRKFGQFTILHNLLSITGSFALQPFVQDDIACVYNGEIYNSEAFGAFGSDGECIISAYKSYGASFARELDGEFAIAIIDLGRRHVILAVDPFATKPLHFSTDGGKVGISSYASALHGLGFENIKRVTANRSLIVSFDDWSIQSGECVFDFDLRQHKNSFDGWIASFHTAIRKRTRKTREKIFIGLSSGYDSGSIACELLKQRVPFKSYSLIGNESSDAIIDRVARFGAEAEYDLIFPCEHTKRTAREFIDSHVEALRYDIYSTASPLRTNTRLQEDPGANGLSIVCSKAAGEKRKIYLSGQGADEIISDYGHAGNRIYDHSNFGGLFPDDLTSIFPWPSFYGSTQTAYLMKEEYVAGAYGIEARYPFLDKYLVQEFLSLTAKLKNSAYKSVLGYYLKENAFPCAFDQKFGFVP